MTIAVLNRKLNVVENKIPGTSSLATTTVLNTKIWEVEKKIPDHAKNVTAHEFNKLTSENLAAKLKQANLATKTGFDNKLTSFGKRITTNKTNHLGVKKKLNGLITKD